MISIVKLILPGSATFLIITFAIGMLLLWNPRTNRLGRRWLLSLLILYILFSVPITSKWLAAPLEWGFHPLDSCDTVRKAQAIIVLDGGTARYRNQQHLVEIPLNTSVLRALEAIRIYRLLTPPFVVVSGGDDQHELSWGPEASALRDILIGGGIPTDRIVLDSQSLNTRAHAMNIVQILQARGIQNFVLVTSPSHMRRAVLAFQAVGANPIPSQCQGSLDNLNGWNVILPSTQALEFTQAAMHEYVGLFYYLLRRYI